MSASDEARDRFKILVESFEINLNEADTRAKIIEPIFKSILGWDESEIKRETPVKKGFIDYTLNINKFPFYIIEAKEYGHSFEIPSHYKNEKYRIYGTITTDKKIKDAIDQVAKYNNELGTTYAVITNGHQFIVFQAYTKGSQWRKGNCYIFKSYKHIIDRFTLFWNLLSKNSFLSGNVPIYFSAVHIPLDFKRPLEGIHNPRASMGKNIIAKFIDPIIRNVFDELIDENQIEILEKCYIKQREMANYDGILGLNFQQLPYYSKKYNIDWFKEYEDKDNKFEINYSKYQRLLMNKKPAGKLMIFLGGVGSGKTTFVHHFFKIVMKDDSDIIHFLVDFRSEPNMENIESFICNSIIDRMKSSYQHQYPDIFKSVNIDDFSPTYQHIVMLFAILTLKEKIVTLVLDNVDHHNYITPLYQERVFEFAQKYSAGLNAIVILNLREESFFRTTKSGVLDSIGVFPYYISPPPFEILIKKRLDFMISILKNDDKDTSYILGIRLDKSQRQMLLMFFNVLKVSLRKTRLDGRRILRTVNNISGGNMRQALKFFSIFMASGNTDVETMFRVESNVPENAKPEDHYQIPHHDILASIILGDSKYYNSDRSYIMNLFQVYSQYSSSHFINLKILDYLFKRKEGYVALENGFVDINDIMYKADESGISRKVINASMNLLVENNLIFFDNQRTDGLDDANYVKITPIGIFYLKELVFNFTYIDYMWQDTLNADKKFNRYLMGSFQHDNITNTRDRMIKRFERCDKFLDYLRQREENEVKENPMLLNNEFSNNHFMIEIIQKYEDEKQQLLKRI